MTVELCPNCGDLLCWNSYFGAMTCPSCCWRKPRSRRYLVRKRIKKPPD